MIKRSINPKEMFITTNREKSMKLSENSAIKKKLRVTAESNLQISGNKHRIKPSRIKPKLILWPQRLSKSHSQLYMVTST